MNVLFVFSLDDALSYDKPLFSWDRLQFGISYISSLLKSQGHTTELVILSRVFGDKNKHRLDETIDAYHPNLICFTSVATQYEFIREMAVYCKKTHPSIFRIVGGPHVTLNPQEEILHTFNAFCIGEGEYPTLELVNALQQHADITRIRNLWIKKNGKIWKNPTRPFLQQLDDLPFPDRDMWRPWVDDNPGSRLSILLGRGCPFNCSYCSNHALRKIAPGIYVRVRSIPNIIRELRELITQEKTLLPIHLEIETIGVDQKWTIDVAHAIERLLAQTRINATFSTNLRITPNADFTRVFRSFRKAHIQAVNIGLESGSERVRQTVLRRFYSNKDLYRTVRQAKKAGLNVNLFNIIGLPGETYADFLETVKVNRICQPNAHMTSIFFPYPGTDLCRMAQEQHLMDKPIDPTAERAKAILSLPGFSSRQIQRSYILFDYYVYKGKLSMYQIAVRTLRAWFRGSVITDYYSRKEQVFIWKLKKRIKKIMGINAPKNGNKG